MQMQNGMARSWRRKPWTRVLLALVWVLFCPAVLAIDISTRYRSPRNPERRIRPATTLIVLHTTEAPARSSLNKLSDRGEAHYCVTEEGSIYAIVDRDRMAFHAGRSMWNGKEDVDEIAIGIECVGYHDKAMSTVQLNAIRALVKQLQAMYHVTDDRVLCHSHVAYGTPNKWQKRKHRGRKRCGMLFAMPSVRRQLGLRLKPAYDPDTRAGRLVVGDDYLRKVLYNNIDTMAAKYRSGTPVTAPPVTTGSWLSRLFGGSKKPDPPKSVSKPVVKPVPKPAAKPAPKAVVKAQAKPAAKSGGVPKSIAQLKSQGFRLLGCVSPANSASKIAGGKWNAADTYYTIRNKVIPGNAIDAAHIERGMGVWRK